MADNRLIAVTGADGFIGKNLVLHLAEMGFSNIEKIGRLTSDEAWQNILTKAEVVFHLAGVNRPDDPAEYANGNIGAAEKLQAILAHSKAKPLVIFASSSKATENSKYGISKLTAERKLEQLRDKVTLLIYRLPNVFGKWCRPNYNSGIATFCHNLARGLPIQVNEGAAVTLSYVDDLVEEWGQVVLHPPSSGGTMKPQKTYETTIGEVVRILVAFSKSRQTSLLDGVGSGLIRALYSTYVSYIPPDAMAYPIATHVDVRGNFSEVLRTGTTGQFSFFTAHVGVTRGGHYHHSKTEKFLVLSGKARFRFRHILTNERRELETEGGVPVVVETIPGWAHDITNVGEDVLICMLWANEIFDKARPDTFAAKVFE